MQWIENKYINLISGQFRNFKRKNNSINFSCPYCGDSKKDKFKARGYLYNKKGTYPFFCHNCGVSRSFDKFLQDHVPELYKQYSLEKLKESGGLKDSKEIDKGDITIPNVRNSRSSFLVNAFPEYKRKGSPLRKLKTISQLEWNHPAKTYILRRQIPNEYHAKLYYCPTFCEWTNTILPGKFKGSFQDESRLIIPFLDEKNKFFGYQGRSFKANSQLRYITIMLDDTKPKMFGLDRTDFNKKVYVSEGPLDSIFVDNCIAMAGSSETMSLTDIDTVMIYDNEPRSIEIIKKMKRAIDRHYSIVIWPQAIKHKDINDMIVGGLNKADVKLIIEQNTYSGLQADMALVNWRRC